MNPAATIAKFEAKPPLWITRYNLIKELEKENAWWLSDTNDCMTQSPFWYFRMSYRHWCSFGGYPSEGVIRGPIIEKVKYDYMLAINQVGNLWAKINMSENETNEQIYGLRQMMWREAQKETLCGLYGKMSGDMVTEIISYC